MRRFVRTLHLWLGLSLGGLFVMLGLTGAILTFYPEIDAALHPEIRVEASAPDWDKALATVRMAYPDKHGPWRLEVTAKPGAIPARYYNPPETNGRDFAPMMVWLSPDGGAVLRRDYWGDYAVTWIYDLHYRMLLGETGGTVLGYFGIALVLLLISGLWAWWPRGSWTKALRYKGQAAPSRKLRDIHKRAGLWGFGFLLILSVTGVMLALPKASDALLSGIFGGADEMPKPHSVLNNGRQIRAAAALRSAQRALPKARITWIEIPGAGDGTFRIRMQQPSDPSTRFPHSFVWIDQYSGRILAAMDAEKSGATTKINNWVHPLHDGSAGGIATRFITATAGLVPLLLFVTGILRWRMRRSRDHASGAIPSPE
jgi:uncharacterized iron-regulated membrane protein